MRSARTGDPGAAWPRADVSDRRRPRAGSRVDELLVLPAPQRDGGRRAAIADPHRCRELRPRVAAEVHLLPGGQEARRAALRDLPRRPQRLEGRAPGDLQLDDLGPVERKPPRSSFAPRIVFRTSTVPVPLLEVPPPPLAPLPATVLLSRRAEPSFQMAPPTPMTGGLMSRGANHPSSTLGPWYAPATLRLKADWCTIPPASFKHGQIVDIEAMDDGAGHLLRTPGTRPQAVRYVGIRRVDGAGCAARPVEGRARRLGPDRLAW